MPAPYGEGKMLNVAQDALQAVIKMFIHWFIKGSFSKQCPCAI